jgi:hypothetical protein
VTPIRAVAIMFASVAAGGCAGAGTGNLGGAAATISMVGGDGQTVAAAQQAGAPITVQVKDTDGTPVSGVTVAFAPSVGATVGHGQVLTDAAGNASTSVTVGSSVGTEGVTASVQGVPATVSFVVTVVAGPPASLQVVSGSGQLGLLGAALPDPLVVGVADQYGNAVAGATIDWSTSAGILVGAVSQTSGADGTASIGFKLPDTAAVTTVTAAVRGTTVAASFSEISTDGVPTTMVVFAGDGQSAPAGTTLPLPLVVLVTDQHNHPVSGVTIDWTTTGGLIAGTPSTLTAADGTASIMLQLPSASGSVTVTATIHGTSTTARFTATAM